MLLALESKKNPLTVDGADRRGAHQASIVQFNRLICSLCVIFAAPLFANAQSYVDTSPRAIIAGERVSIGDKTVLSTAWDIDAGEARAPNFRKGVLPKNWTPDPTKPLDAALPRPWPKRYIEEYQQFFNPNIFYNNARSLCEYDKAHDSEAARAIAVQLYNRYKDYTEERDGAAYVVYKFPYEYAKRQIAAPWTSAYASGAALIGLVALGDCLGIEGAKASADAILEGLARPIALHDERPDLWVSFVDKEGFLWFEEMPLNEPNQPRILNGHIRAITGLYTYYYAYGGETARKLLLAGATTIAHYAPLYRALGETNRYDLLEPYNNDYSPARTIAQQEILFKLTGDPIFAAYRDAFTHDMPTAEEDWENSKKK